MLRPRWAGRFTSSALIFGTLTSGCSSIGYLVQAGRGQLEIINRARPIPEVLKDERVSPETREWLGRVAQIKEWAERAGLKPTQNYKEYVQLNREAAVWVVTACEPLAFKEKEWSFPIVGSFNYLGWFDREDAHRHADRLKAEGWDIDVRGSAAYSTLGWFRDPILSTMVGRGRDSFSGFVNVILHESVHATFFLPGNSDFNEGLATFVGDALTREYLMSLSQEADLLEKHERGRSEENARTQRMKRAYDELNEVYQSKRPDHEKREKKKGILDALRAELRWNREISNATLVQFRTYHGQNDRFLSAFRNCGQDWARYFRALTVVLGDSAQTDHSTNALLDRVESHCRSIAQN